MVIGGILTCRGKKAVRDDEEAILRPDIVIGRPLAQHVPRVSIQICLVASWVHNLDNQTIGPKMKLDLLKMPKRCVSRMDVEEDEAKFRPVEADYGLLASRSKKSGVDQIIRSSHEHVIAKNVLADGRGDLSQASLTLGSHLRGERGWEEGVRGDRGDKRRISSHNSDLVGNTDDCERRGGEERRKGLQPHG